MVKIFASCVALAFAGAAHAGDLGINIILSGEVAPGVYGQVQLGNAPPPPLVYAQPILIESLPEPPPPVYLHVPPGHAKNWRRYCQAYNACNRPVYFVRSEEYSPDYSEYDRYHDHSWKHHDHEDDGDHGRGHGRGHDKEREHDDDR